MFKRIRLAIVIFAGLGLVGLFVLVLPTSAAKKSAPKAAIIVNTLDDELNSDGFCSLREAITAANDNTATGACPAGDGVLTDTVTFAVNGTILLTEELSVIAGGPLVIDGGERITVSGNQSVRVFWVEDNVILNLHKIKIVDGWEIDYTCGGGLYNDGGSVTISNSTITGCSTEVCGAFGNGNSGTFIIVNSNISWNNSLGIGGFSNSWGSTMIISGSNISNNFGDFGGIHNTGTMKIINSTISDNYASGSAGGILNGGNLTISNSTISNNVAEFTGHAIFNSYGEVTIINSTLTKDIESKHFVYEVVNDGGSITFVNSIMAGKDIRFNCQGQMIDGGYNIENGDTCGFDPANGSMPNTDPMIGPLQNNSGSTWTHALLPSSPAIDAADPANCPPTDQRGVQRPQDGDHDGSAICDIGSFEFVLHTLFIPVVVRMY